MIQHQIKRAQVFVYYNQIQALRQRVEELESQIPASSSDSTAQGSSFTGPPVPAG